MNTKRHVDSIDWLRTFAIAAVLIQHGCSYYIDSIGYSSAVNALRGITRWNILIFVMVSGFLFLSRTIEAKVMWKKYIARILRTFLIWSGLYTLYNIAFEYVGGGYRRTH